MFQKRDPKQKHEDKIRLWSEKYQNFWTHLLVLISGNNA